ncbi:hypothetical protein AB0B25_04980 [Nocardia sp. NPDC049190]|uniref:hypothetical protein n=1 Tax=Nocardia sp. NPDC049190 TaxID=3155650 RepID=UPI0033E1FF3B
MSRTELAELLADSAAWSEDSQVAASALQEVSGHIHRRYGVLIDSETGQAAMDGPMDAVARGDNRPSPVADALVAAEQERAALARLKTAQDRLVELVAAEQGLEQSTTQQLYVAIEQWRADPTARQLDALTRTLADKGVGGQVRTRVRFVAAYLGSPGQLVPLDELGAVNAVSATTELRKLG